jgi:hypothetical protein
MELLARQPQLACQAGRGLVHSNRAATVPGCRMLTVLLEDRIGQQGVLAIADPTAAGRKWLVRGIAVEPGSCSAGISSRPGGDGAQP